jgi:uncharacterized Zn finger protein
VSRFSRNRFPAPSNPRPANSGIKAQSQRGAFGEHWWSKRWIGVLEGFRLGTRLTRGRAYARHGQVLEIAIEPRGVRARVQGSRKVPYSVHIYVKPLRAEQWRQVAENIAQTPHFVAMLLNGEIPEDIEDAFEAANCGLFPQSIGDVRTECSCPDWSNPCKHVAAVYYLIGEEFDRDPFLLFALRGLARDAILPALRAEEPLERAAAESASTPRPPLERPPVDAWLLRRTGRFPFWHGTVPLEDALSAVYAKAGERAATLLAETWPD